MVVFAGGEVGRYGILFKKVLVFLPFFNIGKFDLNMLVILEAFIKVRDQIIYLFFDYFIKVQISGIR